MRKKKRKVRILWDRLILAAILMVASLIAFIYLIHLLLVPVVPLALRTDNRGYDSIIEKEKNYTIAVYYPKNIDHSIVTMIQEEVAAYKENVSGSKQVLYIDYDCKADQDFRACRFYEKSGTLKELNEKELLNATVFKNGQIVSMDLLFEDDYMKQISARLRKRLPTENRDLKTFYKNTDPSSAVYDNYRIESDGLVFTFEAADLYKEGQGTLEEKITWEEMSYFLKESVNGISKSDVDLYHERYIDVNLPMVAISYDDGPYSKVTSKLLDLLEQYDQRATFFVVGQRVGNSYDNGCVARAIEMGCEVGNHTYTHLYELPNISTELMMSELTKCEEAVKAVAPEYTMTLLRPTGGALSSNVRANSPYAIVTWSIDTNDWSVRNADEIYEHVMRYIEDGDIILMHDLYEETYEATERFLPELLHHYQFVTVKELYEYKGIEMEAGKVYSRVKS